MTLPRFNHALNLVRTYLVDYADREDWGDPRAAELTQLIRGCVECISVNRRVHGQGGGEHKEQEALRHAIGYLDERSTQAHPNVMTSGLA